MNYADIKRCDVVNGPGVRVSLFVSGCTHHCKECFNPETWDFAYGDPFTEETIDLVMEYLEPDYIKGLTLLGGEPLPYKIFREMYADKCYRSGRRRRSYYPILMS